MVFVVLERPSVHITKNTVPMIFSGQNFLKPRRRTYCCYTLPCPKEGAAILEGQGMVTFVEFLAQCDVGLAHDGVGMDFLLNLCNQRKYIQ